MISIEVGWSKRCVWHMGGQVKDKWPATHFPEQKNFNVFGMPARNQN